jgi:flagellar biosynthesis GTPase FlhF
VNRKWPKAILNDARLRCDIAIEITCSLGISRQDGFVQIRLKNRQRLMEIEEEKQIAAYVREKERRDQEHQDELRRVAGEKEREIARLRSHQERAQDKQAEVDALRARRAQEAYDREQRQKEREARERQQAINADLAAAREMQMREKAALLAEQARAEKEEFDRIIAVQKGEEERERSTRTKETSHARANADSLRKQITEVEENRRKTRRDFLDEGNRLRAEKREREALVDTIRQQKVVELEGMSVPKQYRQELLKKKAGTELRPTK